jgi:dTDP-4-dehydrorhamnose 3,5-epimerase
MMEFRKLAIADVMLLTPKVFNDERGFFMESFRHEDFVKHCGNYHFVQDNHSGSGNNILRGLHYQLQRPQGKLVRVTRGEVFDVAVDLRRNSATFGQWVGEYLSESNKRMMWIPPGFAHGFYVTSDMAEFQYKCTDYYDATDEYALLWNDPTVAVQWPFKTQTPQLSAKDAQGRLFANCPVFE